MHEPANEGRGLWWRSAAELAGVTLLVFTTGWVGVRVAEHVHQRPVSPGRGDVIELRLVKSDRHGDVSFEEGAGYAGWWHCLGKDWAIEWRFAPVPARRYSVEVRVASPERVAGEKILVTVTGPANRGDQVLEGIVPDTGGPAKWKALKLGEVPVAAGVYTLTVRPGSAGLTNLNVKSVILRPLASAS